MTKVIVLQSGNLDSYYEQTMDYIYAKYHTYPTNLPEQVIEPKIMREMSYYEKQARQIADEAQVSGEWPGNKVI